MDERNMNANGASANNNAKVTPIRATLDGLPEVFRAKDSDTISFDIDCFCCQYPAKPRAKSRIIPCSVAPPSTSKLASVL